MLLAKSHGCPERNTFSADGVTRSFRLGFEPPRDISSHCAIPGSFAEQIKPLTISVQGILPGSFPRYSSTKGLHTRKQHNLNIRKKGQNENPNSQSQHPSARKQAGIPGERE